MPAPPPLSDVAIVSALGTMLDLAPDGRPGLGLRRRSLACSRTSSTRSLRRYDPDQVRRVCSQPRSGHPGGAKPTRRARRVVWTNRHGLFTAPPSLASYG